MAWRSWTSLALGGVAALAAVGCTPSPSPADGVSGSPATSVMPSLEPDAASLTAYDDTVPVDLVDEAPERTEPGGIIVRSVSWTSPGGGRVSAWLVVPPGDGPFAGIVYLHGTETNRNDFLDEAIAMAHGGAAAVVIDAPFARSGESQHNFLLDFGPPERERDMNAQAIVDVRRAYDLLLARPDIDAARLGFVGHSWGASAGMVLAAVDPRPGSLVLITGRPSWTGFLRESTDGWVQQYRDVYGPQKWERYLTVLAPFDALAVVDAVDAGRLYLQYGNLDDVVPPDVAQELLQAVPAAKSDRYEAGHALDDAATADRVAWLVERLGLQPIDPAIIDQVGLPDE